MVLTKNLTKLTIKQKAEILSQLKNGVSSNILCSKYKVHKSTISRLKKQEASILKYVANTEVGPGKRKTLKSCEYPKMEKALYKWFVKQRAHNIPLSISIIKAKACKLHEKIREKEGSFHASNGWISNFKKRYGIRHLKICGEKLSNVKASIDPFITKLQNKIKELNLSADQIYNADESGLFFRQTPNKTLVSFKEKSAPGRKVSKERVTFMACTNASGEHKVKIFVIGKAKNPRAFKSFQRMPVVYKANKNAWMTFHLFENWFHHTFVPEVREFLEAKGLEKKALLLVDNAPCHPKDNEMKSDDGMITVMCLPANCTAILQPMDQNVINLTKLYYKKGLLAHLIANDDVDLEQKIKDFNLRHAVCTLAGAWQQVSQSSIQKCWKILLPPNLEWDDEDDIPLSIIIQNMESENTIFKSMLQELAPQENFTNEEIKEWVLEDCAVQEEMENISIESVDNSEVEVSPPKSPKIKDSTVVESFNICIKWCEENNIDLKSILNMKEIRQKAIIKVQSKKKVQATITDMFKKY